VKQYALRKLLIMVLTVLAVSFLTFTAFSVIPGNAATSILGTEATPEKTAALEHELGLDRPFAVRYAVWLGDFLRGNMGTSYSYRIPVGELVAGKLSVTMTLTVMAFIMIAALSIPLGIMSAMHMGKRRDRLIQVTGQIVMAVPPFFMGMILTLVFGLGFKWFTPGGYVSFQDNPAAFFGYLICPALAIALPRSAMAGRFLRNSLVKETSLDYVRTAYSRGNDSHGVFYGHMLRNAMIPTVTFLAVIVPEIVAGSIIVEQVFGIPGIGRILLSSISSRDYPVVQAIVVMITILVTGMNFLADILYHKLDPRVTLS